MTLLLGFGAVNTGNNLLYLLVSALLGFMAVSGVLGKGNIDKLHLRVEFPDEVFDGIETLVRLRLENRKRWLPTFLVTVTLLDQSVTVPIIGPRQAALESLPFTLDGRGRHGIDAARLCSIFPINFFVRCRSLPLGAKVVVFPAPRPGYGDSRPEPEGEGGGRPSPLKGYEGELSRISDYRGGEPLKLIHWKLSARHDRLKVKELSATTREPVIIDPERLPGKDLEERLRHAAFVATRCFRQGRPVGLRLGRAVIAPAAGRQHKIKLLNALGLYGQD